MGGRAAAEQELREAFLSAKLARQWAGGAPWAAVDFVGVALTAEAAVGHLAALPQVAADSRLPDVSDRVCVFYMEAPTLQAQVPQLRGFGSCPNCVRRRRRERWRPWGSRRPRLCRRSWSRSGAPSRRCAAACPRPALRRRQTTIFPTVSLHWHRESMRRRAAS